MANQFLTGLDELRYEPTAKRVRAMLGHEVALDSTRALLVWEPRRIVPQYAVPLGDMVAELVPAGSQTPVTDAGPVRLGAGGPLVLTPDNAFGAHSCGGETLTVRLGDDERPAAAFRLADPDLAGYVLLDFAAFDGWFEEERRSPSSPTHATRSPHRCAPQRPACADRAQRPRARGQPSSELAVRDLPAGPVLPAARRRRRMELPLPLSDAAEVVDMLCFFNERVDVVLDGVRQERPQSPWS